jgi:fluoride exporter
MVNIFLVGIGGFVGSVLRYLCSGYVQALAKSFEFPYGTLVVNVIGCFLIGFLSQLSDAHGALSARSRVFLFIGVLGGFTTFSAFGNETINLLRDSERFLSFMNVACHLLLGLAAVWAGRALVEVVWR